MLLIYVYICERIFLHFCLMEYCRNLVAFDKAQKKLHLFVAFRNNL